MKRRLSPLLAAGAVFALAALGGGATWAAFSSQSENAGSTISAAATFATLPVATGSYAGNGADDRPIPVPFTPDVVIVKANTNQVGVLRSSTMAGDASKPLTGATALFTNRIQSLTATGFVVGNNAQVNTSGTTYQWMAFKSSPELKVGSYTGNGSSNRSIGGIGFSPGQTILLSAAADNAHQRMAGMSRGFDFDGNTGITNGVLGQHADGFNVGNSAQANTSGRVYHYVAFAQRAGSVKVGSYQGNGTTGATVTGVGFQPDYVIVRANDTGTGRNGHHRGAALGGTASQFFSATANSTTGIRALQSDGFQLGNDASVNGSGVTYFYIAIKNSG